MSAMVNVGMGEAQMVRDGGTVVMALGLGSCVAICMYDRVARVGAMAHAMLPAAVGGRGGPFRFADSAVPALVGALEAAGALRVRLAVALVGGAHMFKMAGERSALDIGARNVQAAREAVAAARLALACEDVGGTAGRSAYLHPGTGRLVVRTIGQPERELVVLGRCTPAGHTH